MELLLAYGADVDAKNDKEETALHRAARHGKTEIINLLLDRGADRLCKDSDCEYVDSSNCNESAYSGTELPTSIM